VLKKKICMLGYYGVGKTSLVSQFVSNLFSDKYHTTVGVKIDKKMVEVDGCGVTLMLWDFAGEEDNVPLSLHQVRDASGYLLVADGRRSKTLDAARNIQKRMEMEIGQVPFLLLVNKVDDRAAWEVQDAALAELESRGWTVLTTSAKTGENVEEAFRRLTAVMLRIQHEGREEDDD
jgi:small GTP-binding protein